MILREIKRSGRQLNGKATKILAEQMVGKISNDWTKKEYINQSKNSEFLGIYYLMKKRILSPMKNALK